MGLHGRINRLPAEDVRCFHEWDGDDCSFVVSGTTRQTRVFGENLSLARRLFTRLGSPSLWLEDTVINHGFEPTPHMSLYHCNGGFSIPHTTVVDQFGRTAIIGADSRAQPESTE